jgi:hypothetical protein
MTTALLPLALRERVGVRGSLAEGGQGKRYGSNVPREPTRRSAAIIDGVHRRTRLPLY